MSENARDVQLDWCGPYTISKADKRSESDLPPPVRGIYMWVVGSPDHRIVTYVGQSKDIRKRTYEHVVHNLDGKYRLYEPEALTGGQHKVEFQSDRATYRSDFLCDLVQHLELAPKNLLKYEVYWAELDKPKKLRESVESGLIDELKRLPSYAGTGIHDFRLSRASSAAPAVSVTCALPQGVSIPSFPQAFSYGELHP